MLTGVIRPDAGTIAVNGTARLVCPRPRRRRTIGLAPVFQDPALVPDLTIAQNLRLTGTPVEAVRRHLHELDLDIDFSEQALRRAAAAASGCSTSRARSRATRSC